MTFLHPIHHESLVGLFLPRASEVIPGSRPGIKVEKRVVNNESSCELENGFGAEVDISHVLEY
jgi:hypothetical protein